jgi:hypothetical protein
LIPPDLRVKVDGFDLVQEALLDGLRDATADGLDRFLDGSPILAMAESYIREAGVAPRGGI